MIAVLGNEVTDGLVFLVVVAVGHHYLIINVVMGIREQDRAVGFLCPELIFETVDQNAQMPLCFRRCDCAKGDHQHEGQHECKNLLHSLSSFILL